VVVDDDGVVVFERVRADDADAGLASSEARQ